MRFAGMAAILVCALVVAGPAYADFTGQTILGPLTLGSVVNGDTTGATDDNDGIFSGDHIFFVWNGPDDVWQVNWPGGNIDIQMTYDNTFADLDVFLYRPPYLSDSGDYSIMNSGFEQILYPAAEAGTYYVVVDSTDFSTAGAYTLSILPEPSTLALAGLALAALLRRGR